MLFHETTHLNGYSAKCPPNLKQDGRFHEEASFHILGGGFLQNAH